MASLNFVDDLWHFSNIIERLSNVQLLKLIMDIITAILNHFCLEATNQKYQFISHSTNIKKHKNKMSIHNFLYAIFGFPST